MKKDNDMHSPLLIAPGPETRLLTQGAERRVNVFALPRDFLDNRFVYLTISPRARGLSIGVNVNPDKKCDFNCVYCEVDRSQPGSNSEIDCTVAGVELEQTLRLVNSGELRFLPNYSDLLPELLKLRHVALSGDGEPTLSSKFLAAVETVVHVRARGIFPFFKIVLITNASGLDRDEVQQGLNLFTPRDEIWAKLDAGTPARLAEFNRTEAPLQKIIDNILLVARRRPVIIQSLFCQVGGEVASANEIVAFANQLRELKEAGAQIPLVQIYSATRPTAHSNIRHLPLRTLSEIAATVRRVAGLRAEPF